MTLMDRVNPPLPPPTGRGTALASSGAVPSAPDPASSFRMEGLCDMLLPRLVGAAVLTASATLSITGVANAQDDRDCADFSNQAEAQRFFDSAATNYHRLDADN